MSDTEVRLRGINYTVSWQHDAPEPWMGYQGGIEVEDVFNQNTGMYEDEYWMLLNRNELVSLIIKNGGAEHDNEQG